jgi:hypothetical protein
MTKDDRPHLVLWPEPKMTGNAALLSGYLAGMLSTREEYRTAWEESRAGELVIVTVATGNRFRLRIEQISGEE